MDTILYPLTFAIVLLFSLFLIVLGGVSLLMPEKAKAFLLSFAASAFTHFLEMALRLAVGGSIVFQASYLQYPILFKIFGLMMVGTTAILILLPWKWHRRFAERLVPPALKYLPVIGIVSLALGAVLLVLVLSRQISS